MSNLITTIIGIALLAIVVTAGIYYGGQSYTQSQVSATTSKINNDLQQIGAAAQLYQSNTSNLENSLGTLTKAPSYLNNASYIPAWPSFPYVLNFKDVVQTTAAWVNATPQYLVGGGIDTSSNFINLNVAFLIVGVNTTSGNTVDQAPTSTDDPGLDVCVAYNALHPTPPGTTVYYSTVSTTPNPGKYAIPYCLYKKNNGRIVYFTGTYPNIVIDQCCGSYNNLIFAHFF